MSLTSTAECGVAAVLVIDPLKLRRAGVITFLRPWADSAALTLHAVARKEEFEAAAADAARYVMVILSVGGSSVVDPAVRDTIETVQALLPDVPLVVMGELEDCDEVVAAFHAGVRGFVPASLEPDVALQTFTFILGGGWFFPPAAMMRPPQAAAEAAARLARSRREGHGWNTASHDGRCRLTGRQAEVLALLRQGKSNKVIARELGMQEATVKVHVRQIMRKLGAANRTEAALLAVQAETAALAQEAAQPKEPPAPPETRIGDEAILRRTVDSSARDRALPSG